MTDSARIRWYVMLKDILTSGEIVRVLDYLLDEPGAVLNKSEIAEGAGISRPTLYRLWDRLEALGIMAAIGREEGVEKYRLNTASSLVRSLLRFDTELSSVMADAGISTPEPAPEISSIIAPSLSVDECHFEEAARNYLAGRGTYGLAQSISVPAVPRRGLKRPTAPAAMSTA